MHLIKSLNPLQLTNNFYIHKYHVSIHLTPHISPNFIWHFHGNVAYFPIHSSIGLIEKLSKLLNFANNEWFCSPCFMETPAAKLHPAA